MKEVSTGQLRNNLAHWLWHIRKTGETITVTNYGRAVAVLGPPPEDEDDGPGADEQDDSSRARA